MHAQTSSVCHIRYGWVKYSHFLKMANDPQPYVDRWWILFVHLLRGISFFWHAEEWRRESLSSLCHVVDVPLHNLKWLKNSLALSLLFIQFPSAREHFSKWRLITDFLTWPDINHDCFIMNLCLGRGPTHMFLQNSAFFSASSQTDWFFYFFLFFLVMWLVNIYSAHVAFFHKATTFISTVSQA